MTREEGTCCAVLGMCVGRRTSSILDDGSSEWCAVTVGGGGGVGSVCVVD